MEETLSEGKASGRKVYKLKRKLGLQAWQKKAKRKQEVEIKGSTKTNTQQQQQNKCGPLTHSGKKSQSPISLQKEHKK